MKKQNPKKEEKKKIQIIKISGGRMIRQKTNKY